ncbi:hypothetical protein [Nonomuraea dietziae]|uniref:hypothetical protein n=1 Tax=Nonomuraea dietziae TaxID=65515 RepID=UPI0031CFB771
MIDLGAGLSVVPPTPLPGPPYGGAGADWAGGVAVHADGSPPSATPRAARPGSTQW